MYKPGERPGEKAGQALSQDAASSAETAPPADGAPPAAATAVSHKAENMDGDDPSSTPDGPKKEQVAEKKADSKSEDASTDD